MTKEKVVSSLFGLNAQNWMRHANPWSVYTRNTVLPLIILAVWSRVWIGWYCFIPICLSLLWAWINPIVFSKPKSTKNWASRAVLGERVWLNRKSVELPDEHRLMPHILSAVAAVGAILVIWGVFELHEWMTLLGCSLVYGGKLWFLDRMVWLYLDMKNKNDEYKSWSY